mgnify:CR=1 FL=1
MNDKKNPMQSLEEILSFKPTSNQPGAEAFKAALDIIKEERKHKAQQAASKAIGEAIALYEQLKKDRQDFEARNGKAEKNLEKLVKSIQAMAAGAEAPIVEEPKTENA